MFATGILSIGGNDPTGAAGLTMDTRVGQCFHIPNSPILSCLSAQDGETVSRVDWLSKEQLQSQLKAVFKPNTHSVIKIGLFANRDLIDGFVDYYQKNIINQQNGEKNIIIYDPIFANGHGCSFLSKNENLAQLVTHIKQCLLPICSIVTPNHHELAILNDTEHKFTNNELSSSAEQLLKPMERQSNCLPTVILSGGHGQNKERLTNTCFFLENDKIKTKTISQKRFLGNYRGTGCALASSIACMVVKGVGEKGSQGKLSLDAQYNIIQQGFDFVHRAVASTYEKNRLNPQMDSHNQILFMD